MSIYNIYTIHSIPTIFQKTKNWLLPEIKNLYVGWVYNPIIGQWNKFADFHNARVVMRGQEPIVIGSDAYSAYVMVDGQKIYVGDHWFDADMQQVLKAVSRRTGQPVSDLKKRLKSQKPS